MVAVIFIANVARAQSAPAPAPAAETPASQTPAPQASTPAQLQAMIDRGNSAEALKAIEPLAAEQPVPAGVKRLQGQALYALNRLGEADAAFAAAIQQDPHDQESAQMRGLTLFRMGKPAAAIPLLTGAQGWSPQTRIDPSYVLALCYLDTRQYDLARQAFAAQFGFAPDSAQSYLLAARMLLRREFVPIAQDFAHKALELDPQLPLAHGLLGEIALAGEHHEEAIAEFEKELAKDPLEGNSYYHLGDAYLRSGDYQHAQQSLDRAVLLEPNATGPYILLGKLFLKRQIPSTAAMYLERAEKLDPGNFMTHSQLGQAYRMLGRAQEASRETQTAQQIQAASEPKFQNAH